MPAAVAQAQAAKGAAQGKREAIVQPIALRVQGSRLHT